MQDAGALKIELGLSGGYVCVAAIKSSRLKGVARLFEGRVPEEAPTLARRLYSLCSRAQGAASTAAVEAALGRRPSPDALRAQAVGVLAERVFETLRAMVVGWPGAATFARRASAPLREAAAAAEAIARGDASQAALTKLAAAAEALGLGAGDPQPETPFGQILAQCSRATGLVAVVPDVLTAEDDEAVAQGLEADPAGFASAPRLEGRQPETGAYARMSDRIEGEAEPLRARALARLADVRAALGELENMISRKDPSVEAVIVSGRTAAGSGFSAVECARGRLYHLAQINGNGRLEVYAHVAPTEWNFHHAGPLAAQLLGARLGRAEAAQTAAERLVALVDPCVAAEVTVREAS